MVHLVDLGTHTVLIRSLDPLNLLRYSEKIWNLLSFSGSPNRIRMSDYRNILNQVGFDKVETKQITVLGEEYVRKSRPYLSDKFRIYSDGDLKTKSFCLLAGRK